ncbi:MAG: lipoprotein [Saprospiraceae bacterium]|nr:MAG: lipoprotein [Saprospiraceae bacterium]
MSSASEISVFDFPNILNYKGLPENPTDRSVFMFSDLGAWHGYALPKEERGFLGSFIGPFLMTQDNGVWMSESLSKLDIIHQETGKPIDWKQAEIIENNAFPNQLKQQYKFNDPPLLVQTELIFISDRTALTKVSIQNRKEKDEVNLGIQWSGQTFLDSVQFSSTDNALNIAFTKNGNIALILVNERDHPVYQSTDTNYEIKLNDKSLKPHEIWTTYLTHTFCFSEQERQQEEAILQKAFDDPDVYFAQNLDRWNAQVAKVINALDENFNTEAHQKMAIKCLETLNNNWRSPAGFLKYQGLFPSYNYEWFNGFWSWDSWKHAVAVAHFDTDLAQDQILAMYDFQDSLGMIADCVYRDNTIENHNWRDSKPPLSAWAIWEVYKESSDKDFLRVLFPKAEKYHQWWYDFRDHDQNGLCEYGSTDGSLIAAKWESGMDNAVRFDETSIVQNNAFSASMNRESVDLNAYLFAEKQYLAKIAEALGETEKCGKYKQEAAILKTQIQTIFYDEETGWFYDIDLDDKEQFKVFGAEGWIPLWAGAATQEQAERIRETMTDTTKFATYIPFPTLAADHPKFQPDGGYWRGPVWLDQAYFAIKGLKNYGFDEDALRFSNHLFDRLQGLKNDDAPIRENYHPLTGEGLESNHFSWSAAHLLLLLMGE